MSSKQDEIIELMKDGVARSTSSIVQELGWTGDYVHESVRRKLGALKTYGIIENCGYTHDRYKERVW